MTLEDQIKWELKHRDLGREKVLETLRKSEEGGRATDTPLGTGVLRKYVLWLSQRISQDITVDLGKPGRSKAHSPLLKDLDPDAVALITLSTVVNTLSQDNRGLSAVAMSIGKTVYGELALCSFRDMNEELYETLVHDLTKKMSSDLRHRMTVMRMQAEKAGIEIPEWTPAQKLQVGLYLVSLIDGEDGIVEQYTDFAGGKTKYHLQLRPEVVGIMSNAEARVLSHAGFAVPCLIPPQPWHTDGSGGFHGALRVRAPRFFKGTSQQWEIMQQHGSDLTIVHKMLNIHQNVAWQVNPYILDVLKGMRKLGLETEGVQFTASHPKPERPLFLDLKEEQDFSEIESEEFLTWKRQVRDWHTRIRKVAKAESKVGRVIFASEDVLHLQKLYFVYTVDDRGRMYPVSGALNPQGSDEQKALLMAAKGKPITAQEHMDWFLLNAASKYGVDKLSIEGCIRWAKDNLGNMLNAAKDPLNRDAFHWWSSADKPLQFLAVCHEYLCWTQDPGYEFKIAVAMDGTCNGLQNYSALLRDEVGGTATNLIGSPGTAPNDIYGDVARAAWARMQKLELDNLRRPWEVVGFNRSLTKTSVMTQVYGSTFGTCRKSIVAYCVKEGLFEDDTRWNLADYASHLVWDGIGDVVVKAKLAMDWLRNVAGAVMKRGDGYITYLSPSGMRIVQMYQKTAVKRVQAQVGTKITLRLREESDKPDKIRHRNALPPNFIHSVDSSHMAYVTVAMDKQVQEDLFLHMVHDDFGALPADASALYHSIRKEFVTMHSNYDIETAFTREYPDMGLPPAPSKGMLDLNSVLTSPNFFR